MYELRHPSNATMILLRCTFHSSRSIGSTFFNENGRCSSRVTLRRFDCTDAKLRNQSASCTASVRLFIRKIQCDCSLLSISLDSHLIHRKILCEFTPLSRHMRNLMFRHDERNVCWQAFAVRAWPCATTKKPPTDGDAHMHEITSK